MARNSGTRSAYLAALTLLSAAAVNAQDCGGFFVAFGYEGENQFDCNPYVDAALQQYLAWYNGSTTMTLTGNAAECPDVSYGPLSNSLGIGGMSVAGNSSLDRSSYDTNPFYFHMPYAEDENIAVDFQSSSDDYYTETQSWTLQATKSGDGYDVTGQWTGNYPTNNYYYHPTTDCWQGGDFWPNAFDDTTETISWDITGHLTVDSATWNIQQTWLTKSDGITWHLTINFQGTADATAPRLVTAGEAPTTDAVAAPEGAEEEETSSSSETGSPTSSDSSAATESAESTGTGSSSGSGSETSSASGSSSTNAGSKALAGMGSMTALAALAAGALFVL